MKVETQINLLEEIFSEWKGVIGSEYEGYKNHVYRMINFCFMLRLCSDEEKKKIIIAGAFHDIGIWINDTVDYIPPSIPPMISYLKENDLVSWTDEIKLMITEHHKITEYKNEQYYLVELFRKADLVDFSFGLVKFGLSKAVIENVRSQIPNAGFHKNLGKRAWFWFLKHPFNSVPMMKW
jgi:hypothetical protein